MKTTFHRNLNAKDGNMWSFNVGQGATQAREIYAVDVSIKQPSGKKFEQCLQGAKRAVFAWFKTSQISTTCPPLPVNAIRIRFNPKNGDKFFHVDGKRVDHMRQVWAMNDGTCWAII